jgi:hypothetical protein
VARVGGKIRGMNMVYMCISAKMIPAETVPGIREGMKKSSGGGEFKHDTFDTL